MSLTKIILILSLLLGLAETGFAGDRQFSYVYQSTVLGKNQRELEIWNTHRFGKAATENYSSFYSALDHRTEFEIGLTNRLQTSIYMNYSDSMRFDTAGNSLSGHRFGISSEWKYKLSDPVANAIGSALYGEIGLWNDELELEGKLILDKHFGNFITAFNMTGEWEFENEFSKAEKKVEAELDEVKLTLDYGIAYRINKRLAIGLEIRNNNLFESEGVSTTGKEPEMELEHSALFIGPNISYTSENWWMVLTTQPQVASFKGNGLDLAEYERFNTRLLFSFHL